MTARKGFDARAYWAGLGAEDRQALGEMAVLVAVGWLGQARRPRDPRWRHAVEHAALRITEMVSLPLGYCEAGPDLAALGIRACRGCGCTDISGCAAGCSWVEADLCSECAAADGCRAGCRE